MTYNEPYDEKISVLIGRGAGARSEEGSDDVDDPRKTLLNDHESLPIASARHHQLLLLVNNKTTKEADDGEEKPYAIGTTNLREHVAKEDTDGNVDELDHRWKFTKDA